MAGSWTPNLPQSSGGKTEWARNESSDPTTSSSTRTSSPSNYPFIPTTATTSPDNYGGLNPENEAVLDIIDGVSGHNPRRFARLPEKKDPVGSPDSGPTRDSSLDTTMSSSEGQAAYSSRLLSLPPELVDAILSHLTPYELVSVSATCQSLRSQALSDILWQPLVQANTPGVSVRTPNPCPTFHQLYAEHDRLWHLPKYKLWFCDRDLTGKLILVRYDSRRGCIEGFQLLAVSQRTSFEQWAANERVVIHRFHPVVKLHLDKPVVQFKVGDRHDDGGFSSRSGANPYADEIPMALDERLQHMYSNFLLGKRLEHEDADAKLALDYPYGHVWPPPAIPAREHATGVPAAPHLGNVDAGDRPRRRDEVSEQTFHIRRWIQMTGTPVRPNIGMDQMGDLNSVISLDHALRAGPSVGAHMGEEIMTYSTLDPALYTPTALKPWRGIWVGDYSGHGCEFLLVNQPDDPPATDAELDLVRLPGETNDDWEKRRLDARVYRGRLEAIKLTGDPNVPRGEYTFVADDLGADGFVGVATEPPFTGARIVKSKGHVAATGFVQDKFIESQLLLLGPNQLAQYWVGFGHISLFQRVDIDEHLDPAYRP